MGSKNSRNLSWNIKLKRFRNSGQIGQAGNDLTQNQYNYYNQNNQYNQKNQKFIRQWRIPKALIFFAASEGFMILSFKSGVGSLAAVADAPLPALLLMPISGLIVGLIPILGELGVLVFMLSGFLFFSAVRADLFLFIGLSLALLTGVSIRKSLFS